MFFRGPQIRWKNNILFNTGEYGQQIARLHNSTSCMIYSKLRLSWIDLGYLLSLSHYSLHTDTHSSDRLMTIMLLPVEFLYTHSVSASHSAPALGRLSHFLSFNSVGGFLFVFFIPSSSSQLLPFKAPIPQGWNPLSPSRAVALFEGCCDDRPRLCRRHTASSQRLYSGPGQHSTVGAFHNPTHTLTLSLTVNSTSASCQRGREQGHAVSQRDTHRWTQKKIQAHTHTSGSSILHPRW